MTSPLRCLVLAVLVVLAQSPRLPAAWNAQAVDAPPSFVRSSLRTDPAGNPAVAYGDDHVYYASWHGSSWTLQVVDDTTCASGVDLAFDASGLPAISYTDRSGGAVRLARWDGSRWDVQIVGEAYAYSTTSLAFDAAGRPALAYTGRSNEMLYAAWTGSAWSIEQVDSAGWGPSLEFDGAWQPVVGYSAYDLEFRTWVNVARLDGSWQIETLAVTFSGMDTVELGSLAIDAAGEPAVTWENVNDVGETRLYLSRWDGAGWVDEMLVWSPWGVFEGLQSSLTFDAAGHPLVAHREGEALVLNRWDGTRWVLEQVTDPGEWPSLALAPGDVPLVTSFDPLAKALELAAWTGSIWSSQEIDHSAEVGEGPSLALDAADRPAVSYLDSSVWTPDAVRFARWDGAAWVIEVLDETGHVSGGTSLAFDASDHPAVAYSDSESDELRLARWDGSAWSIDVVAGDVLTYHSLAFDAGGLPALSYYATTGDNHLALARWNGSGWDIEVVDGVSLVGGYNSLAFDASGHPAIGYYDFGNQDLRFARWNGSSWNIEVVDEAGEVGRSCHLAFDPAGQPAIAYFDATNRRAKLARWDGAAWHFEFVADGTPQDLVFDAAGQPLVTYQRSRLVFILDQDGSHELIDDEAAHGSLSLDSTGRPFVAYHKDCLEDLRLATDQGRATLYRGLVTSLDPGWRTSALPLTSANDVETPPFPLDTTIPATLLDDLPGSGEPLRLYRVLWPGDRPARNTLKLVKDPAGVALTW